MIHSVSSTAQRPLFNSGLGPRHPGRLTEVRVGVPTILLPYHINQKNNLTLVYSEYITSDA